MTKREIERIIRGLQSLFTWIFYLFRKILVVRDVKDTIKESCFEDLIEAIATLELDNYFVSKISPLEIKCINGSRIIFRGLDKTRFQSLF